MGRVRAILAIVLTSLCAAPGISGAAQVKVMTWNIADTVSETSWNSSNAQKLGRVANFYQPDVLALNECACGSTETARQKLTQSLTLWADAYLPDWPEKHVYVSALGDGYNRNAFVSRYPMYAFTEQALAPRGLVGAMIDLPGDIDVKVYTAHLKAFSDYNSAQQRQNGANIYKNSVINWSYPIANAAIPYILTGDWNEDETNPQYPLSEWYHPITTVMESYVNEFNPDDGWGKHKTYSSGSPTRRFDYILPSWHCRPDWTNSGLSWSRVINTMVLYDHGQLPAGLYRLDSQCSDHLCVIGTFDLLDGRISSIRASADGEYVTGTTKYVTASYSDHFYVQEPREPFAVRVNSAQGNPQVGYIVNFKGFYSSSPLEEDAVQLTGLRVLNTVQGVVRPMGLRNRDINGESHAGVPVDGSAGPGNAGLLVKTWGRVVEPLAEGYFWLDDGSGYRVRVQSTKVVALGDYVSAVGVVGYDAVDAAPRRLIKTRTEGDVQIYNP